MAESGIEIKAEKFLAALVATQRPALDRPVALALSDTARSAKSRAGSLIARRTGLNAEVARSRIYYEYVRPGQYQVTIRSSRRGIALIEFPGTSQVATGVRTRAWGKSQIIRGAFIANGQVFRRRTGAGRLPIRKLWGPNIFGTFATPEVQNLIASTMRDRLRATLLRRIASAQRRRS